MAELFIPGEDDILELREAGGSDDSWLRLVCSESDVLETTSEVTEADTKCGPYSVTGDMKAAVSGEAVCNATPTSLEVSLKQMLIWQKAKTLLDYRSYNGTVDVAPESDAYHVEGQGRVSRLQKTGATKDVVKFSWELATVGEPELEPQS